MPAPYTPSPRIGATDPPLPDGPASNAAPHRELLDNRRHLRGSTWGQLIWSGRIVVGGTHTAPEVTVGAIEAVTLRDGSGVWRPYYALAETTVGAAQVEGGGSLSADTWYYLYAHDAGGTGSVQFQLSTTAPTATQTWKDAGGTALYRYLGCFPTDGSGDPFPLRAVHGHYRYDTPIAVGNSYQTPGDGELVSLAAYIPPHTRHVDGRASVTRSTSTNNLLAHVLDPSGSASSASKRAWSVVMSSVPAGTTFAGTFSMLTDSSRRVRVVGDTDSVVTLSVVGFEE